jgi:NDP-hexose C3-ketoreductase / dTDP-4-oxo-2-deoxy-alpha-D-pentos-2-ene 2,3-reductase
MHHRRLGRSGVRVSALGLGTMNFGGRTPEPASFDILDAAVDAGMNFLDTADQYGGVAGVGATEHLLGRWFAQRPGARDRIVLATKAHEPMSSDVNDRGLSARHIRRACEASLRRLGVDHIDLYQLHHYDRSAPLEETWQALDVLITQGKIVHVGTSNFPGWVIATAAARTSGGAPRVGIVSEQHLYHLLERRAELEVIPACEHHGVGLLPWSPLAGGLLAPAGGNGRRSSERAVAERQAHATQLGAFASLAADLGTDTATLALAWLLHRPVVASVIVGPSDLAQLTSVLAAPDLVLTHDALARIDEIFPAVGPAPEAYAW